MLLQAAIKIQRPPNKCAVFGKTPQCVLGAHDVEMRAIAFHELYPRYELGVADLCTQSFEDLSIINIRRLFRSLEPAVDADGSETRTPPKVLVDQADAFEDDPDDAFETDPLEEGGAWPPPGLKPTGY